MVRKLSEMSDIVLGSHQKIKNGVSQKAFVYTRPPIALNMQEQQCGLENENTLEAFQTNQIWGRRANNCLASVSQNWTKLLFCGLAWEHLCGS